MRYFRCVVVIWGGVGFKVALGGRIGIKRVVHVKIESFSLGVLGKAPSEERVPEGLSLGRVRAGAPAGELIPSQTIARPAEG